MHLEIEKASEEVQARLLVVDATVRNGFVHKSLGFKHFLKLDGLIDMIPSHRVGIRTHYRDYLQTVWVFVARILLPSFREEFTGHEIVFVVHSQNALAEPFVVDGGSVDLAIFINFADIILSNLVLFDRHVPV